MNLKKNMEIKEVEHPSNTPAIISHFKILNLTLPVIKEFTISMVLMDDPQTIIRIEKKKIIQICCTLAYSKDIQTSQEKPNPISSVLYNGKGEKKTVLAL